MSSFNCCLLTSIQISQDAGQVVWYFHLFRNFPQSAVIHTDKGFGMVNKGEIDAFFWNSLAFLMIQWMLAIWSLVPLPFLKPAWTSGSSWFTFYWSLAWRILSITLLACEIDCRWEKKGTTEDEIVGWHHRLNGHEFEQTPGNGERQGAWHAAVHGVKSQTQLGKWTTTNIII